MSSNRSAGRLAGLDHLRALAIILVFLYHYRIFGNPPAIDTLGVFGWTGVDLFFVLSGYLIGGQLLGSIAKGKPISYGVFYFKRVMRIIPAYAVVLMLYYTVPAFIERSSLPPLWKFITFTQNFGLDLSKTAAFSHAWSLCIEEQFYLILPLFIIALTGPSLSSSRSLTAVNASPAANLVPRNPAAVIGTSLLALFLLGFLIRHFAWNHYVAPAPGEQRGLAFYQWIYYPTYSRLDGLLAGVGLATLFHFKPGIWTRLTRYGNLTLVLGIALIVAAAYTCTGFATHRTAVFGFPLIAIAYGILVLSALSPTSILYRTSSKITSFIAAISYSFYLVHKQLIHLTHLVLEKTDTDRDSYQLFWVSALASLAAAIVLHYAVERPFLRLRDRMLRSGQGPINQ